MEEPLGIAFVVALILSPVAIIFFWGSAAYYRVQAVRNRLPRLTRRQAFSLRPALLTQQGVLYRKRYLRALTIGFVVFLFAASSVLYLLFHVAWFIY